jgi:hypothetical protein
MASRLPSIGGMVRRNAPAWVLTNLITMPLQGTFFPNDLKGLAQHLAQPAPCDAALRAKVCKISSLSGRLPAVSSAPQLMPDALA